MSQWNHYIQDPTWSEYQTSIKKADSEIGSFLKFTPHRGVATSTGPLAGLPLAVKDNIAVKGESLSCASKMLETMVSPYDATVIGRLAEAGVRIAGKVNLDEFAMGSSTDNSALATTNNPWDTSRVAGGSSGGSAAAVAAGLVPIALGSDTGGSVRQPAAFCGVYGLKPSYGALSRYGLVAFASSLDTIGILGMDPQLIEQVFDIARGADPMDQTSGDVVEPKEPGFSAIGDYKIGYLENIDGLKAEVAANYRETIEYLKGQGAELVPLDMDFLPYTVPTYYTIATAEASANLARYTGIRYGHRPVYSENPEELMRKARDEAFGDEVKLRILLGTYVLRSGFQDQFYGKAQAIRADLKKQVAKLFTSVDSFVLPTFPTQAFLHGEAELSNYEQRIADTFTSLANLTGIPAMAVPSGEANSLPLGVQFFAPFGRDHRLFPLARGLSGLYQPRLAPGYEPAYTTMGDV